MVFPGKAFSFKKPRSTLVPVYHKNQQTGDLIQVGEEDLSKKIDSFRHSAYDEILDRLLDGGIAPDPVPSALDDPDFMMDALDLMIAQRENLSQIRQTLDLPEDLPDDKTREILESKYADYLKKLPQKGEIQNEVKETNPEPVETPVD